MVDINRYGWNEFFQKAFDKINSGGMEFGRIITENKTNYIAATKHGEIRCELTGKLLFESEIQSELPKVGDWVTLSLYDDNTFGIIHEVLERKSKLSRKSPDRKTNEQIIVSNVDKVFVVQSLDETFNLNRLERYLTLVYQSKSEPVIVLTKKDLCNDTDLKIKLIKNRNIHCQIFSVSSITKNGIYEISKSIKPRETVAFIGISGVGKSTLINELIGFELLKTREVRVFDSKGKHTTTSRNLLIIPNGGILIDTPGMRELALWNSNEGFANTFSEFENFARNCKYSDCTHIHEKECAVLKALEEGLLSSEKYENYLKLNKELIYLESKIDQNAALIEKRKWKNIHKEARRMKKFGKR